MAGTDAGVLPHSPREIVPPRSRPPVVLPAVMAAEGAAFAVLAGLDGSAAWQAARVLTVVVVTAWAVWFTGRAAKGVTHLLREHGFDVVAEPESFLVTRKDRLEPQEQDRARDWAAKLAGGITQS